jgi:hypothetical protein
MTRLILVAVPTVVFLATVILVLRRLFHLPEAVAPENTRREMAATLRILPVATGELE